MTEVKKIKNVKFSPTEDKIKNDWTEIKSFRNRLLQNSDWIHMPDNNIEDGIIELWIEWRRKVRRVDDFKDKAKALQYLTDLQLNAPPVKYKNSDYSSVELYKAALHKLLKKTIKKTTDGIYELTDSRELLMERFEEALRYMDGKRNNNFLIEMEVEYTGLSEEEVVKKFLDDRKNYLIKLITIEKVKKQYSKRIDSAKSFDECDKIREDLLVLGQKKWI